VVRLSAVAPQADSGAATYWAAARGQGLWRYELAGDELPQDWASAARAVLCAHDEKVEWIEYFDKAARRYRAARLTKGKLESCIFIGPGPELPPRDWWPGYSRSKPSTPRPAPASWPASRPRVAATSVARCVPASASARPRCRSHSVRLRDRHRHRRTPQGWYQLRFCLPEIKGLITHAV